MRTSEIIVDRAAVGALVRMGDLPAEWQGYVRPRADGRFLLTVSETLRKQLDGILVRAGKGNHSDAIMVIEYLAEQKRAATPGVRDGVEP